MITIRVRWQSIVFVVLAAISGVVFGLGGIKLYTNPFAILGSVLLVAAGLVLSDIIGEER